MFRNQHENFAKRSLPGAGTDVLPAIPALIDRGKQTLARFFAALESYLGEAEFVAGKEFTMADITAICAIDFAAWVEIKIPEQNTRSLDWYERVSARPRQRELIKPTTHSYRSCRFVHTRLHKPSFGAK